MNPPDRDDKVRENRLRRMADRQGFAVRKSRRRDHRAIDFQEIWLMRFDVQGLGPHLSLRRSSDDAWLGPFRSLDELEDWLNDDPDTRPRP